MKNYIIIISILFIQSANAQKNLDFEHWDINNIGIDEAKEWVNIADASKYGAPQVLFKEVENPANGLASIMLKTGYWKEGAEFGLDTLVGAVLQEVKYKSRPYGIEFNYKANPAIGDEVLVGIQLSKVEKGELIVIGEAYFTTKKSQENWNKVHIPITYFTEETPEKISFMALSSANATILTGEYGSAKIGSTLWLDDVKIIQHINNISSPSYTFLSPIN